MNARVNRRRAMKPIFTWSIRTHLLLLVLAAAIPAFALVWWSGKELERQAVDKAGQATLQLAGGMNEWPLRPESSWMMRAMSVLPVPDSPSSSTVALVGATLLT